LIIGPGEYRVSDFIRVGGIMDTKPRILDVRKACLIGRPVTRLRYAKLELSRFSLLKLSLSMGYFSHIFVIIWSNIQYKVKTDHLPRSTDAP